jgi:hypothetical protein
MLRHECTENPRRVMGTYFLDLQSMDEFCRAAFLEMWRQVVGAPSTRRAQMEVRSGFTHRATAKMQPCGGHLEARLRGILARVECQNASRWTTRARLDSSNSFLCLQLIVHQSIPSDSENAIDHLFPIFVGFYDIQDGASGPLHDRARRGTRVWISRDQ